MPSVRFGRVHVYNNYYNAASIQYCTRTRLYAECLVEGNFFENVINPWELLTTTGNTGKLYSANNNISFMDTSNNVIWLSDWYNGQSLIPGTDSVFTPPYSYTLSKVEDVKDSVINYAGNINMVTPVNVNEFQEVPIYFALNQNYPNPFNPSTTFSFSIPERSFVSLKIYDLLGNEVAIIVSEELNEGNYSKQWDAKNLASGIYFYRLQTMDTKASLDQILTETRKLILLK